MVSITFISGLTTWLIVVTILISSPVSGATVGFNDTCDGSASVCDTDKSLECVTVNTTKHCKCTDGLYFHNDTCKDNAIANLKVLNLQATAVSPTQIKVDWSLPTHVSAINRFEVVWTGNAVPVTLSSSTTTYTINNLTSETSYNVVVTSVDTTSRPTEQKVHPDQVTAITFSVVGFDAPCNVSAVCDTLKSFECEQTTCKCNTGLYYYVGTCTNNQIANLKVLNLQATALSPTQIKVDWSLPTHESAINRFEVLWTYNPDPVILSSSNTTYTIINLTPETLYSVRVTSVDTTSRLTVQEVYPTEVTATTASVLGFDTVCIVSADCDTSKSLECVGQSTKTCKCQTGLYSYGGTCTNNQISELKVTNVQVSPTGTNSLYVTWTNPAADNAIESKQVRWTGTPSGTKNISVVSATSTSITGLTPGGTYSITVVSIDTNSRNIQQEATSDAVQQKTKSALGGPCSLATDCEGLTVECDGKCQCQKNFYDDNNAVGGGTCKPISDLKVTNVQVSPAGTNSLYVTWTNPTANNALESKQVRWSGGSSGSKNVAVTATSTTITGLTSGITYSITVVSIDDNSRTVSQEVASVAVQQKTKSALGGSCTSNTYCDGTNAECYNSNCQCKTNFYDDNNAVGGGTCKPISELKVTNVQVIPAGTDSLNVTWTNPTANSAIESKQVRWTGTTSGSDTVAIGDMSTTITGLTSGGTYSITVVSIDTNSRNMQQEVSTTAVSVTIKPAIPGEIKTNNPDNSGTQVTLSWIASVGVVSYYNVVFEGGNGKTRTQTSPTNSSTMISLTPGRRYNITITAKSGSMTSDPRYGNTRTTVTVPEAPTNLRCMSVMDTNVTLEWTPPVNPNGDIMYYSINVTFGPGSPRTVNTTKPVQIQEIDKLTEDSDYSFTVRTRNDLYDGPTSLSATCKTKPGLPSKPQNLSPVTVQSRSLTVGWMKPNATKGSLIGYRIIVQNGTTCSKEILYQCSNCSKEPNLTSSCSMNLKTMVAITDSGLTNESFVQTIEGLSPYVSYSVLVNAITGAGDGYSGAVTVETNEEAPQNLTQVSADVLNSTAIKLSWSIQDPRPGKTTYTIYLYDVINEKQALNKSIEVLGFYERSTILTNLEEYWQYVINIKASTNKGQSAMKTVKPEKTKPAAPGKIANFMVSRPEGNYKSATVTWSIPSLRDQNSLITSYEFKHNATGTVASKILSQSVNNGDGFTESIKVEPENYYYIEVYAINNQNQTGVKSSELYYAPPGPPPKLDSSPDIKVIQNDIKTPTTETTVTILLYQNQFTADENGQIINNGIILCPKGKQIATQRQYTDYDKFTTWKKAKIAGFNQCYKPTNNSWLQNSKKETVQKRSTHEHISYTIGEDTTCDQKSENSYCNGPLNPGKSYQAYTFVCTKGGCTESQAIVITTVEPPPPIPFAIIGGVIGALVVIIIVSVVVIVLKKRKARKGNTHKKFDELKDFTDETETIQRRRPFQLQDCAARVADLHRDANLKFAAEYEDIKTLSPKHPTEAAEMDQNRLKNRYVNILPFDHSRVKLLPIDDDESTDFINANYLPGYNSPREYIGTQGPIPGTIDDFWRMVWEQNVGIIVMLTLLKEEGRIKCEEYWPMERNDPKQYGELVVETTSYSTVNFYDFRIFKIKLGDKVRTVKHFHFLNWKDFSANVQNDVMIDFIQNVRSHVQPPDKEGPMIVHCSAGVGRTGTYICLDHLMQLINEHDLNTAIDIFDLVLKLRDNRSFMVQTEQQYVFIHDCVKDMIEKKKLALQDQGDEDLYMNQDENLYENRAFEAEENLYQNVDTRTDL